MLLYSVFKYVVFGLIVLESYFNFMFSLIVCIWFWFDLILIFIQLISPCGGHTAAPRIYGSAIVAFDVVLWATSCPWKFRCQRSLAFNCCKDLCKIFVGSLQFLADSWRCVSCSVGLAICKFYSKIHVEKGRLAARLAVLGGFFALRFVLGGCGDLQIYIKIHIDRVRLAARLAVLGGFFTQGPPKWIPTFSENQ